MHAKQIAAQDGDDVKLHMTNMHVACDGANFSENAKLPSIRMQWGLCAHVIIHTILPPSPVIFWIELGGKPKWLPLNFGCHEAMRTAPI